MPPIPGTSSTGVDFGWVDSPEGRGTIDILWSGLLTLSLCSWSVLCMNVPDPATPRWLFYKHKIIWMVFTLLFPEVVAGLAAEQLASARQSVKSFRKTSSIHWTLKFAFFADMGGFWLSTPDFPAFPVDALQMQYLLETKAIELPLEVERQISDKNKADGAARTVIAVQTLWFTLQCFGRLAQHQPLSTFELSTLAFVSTMVVTFVCWRRKPLDVEAPIILNSRKCMRTILAEAGERAKGPCGVTSLSFLAPPPNVRSILAPFWFSIEFLFNLGKYQDCRPIQSFPNSKRTAPKGLGTVELVVSVLVILVCSGIHLFGWSFHFPTRIEAILWKVASLLLVSVTAAYLVAMVIVSKYAEQLSMRFFSKRATTGCEFISLLPYTVQAVIFLGLFGLYCSARVYIIVEMFVWLRSPPAGVFSSVNWSNFIPHF